jgi:uncharacterized membrane protein
MAGAGNKPARRESQPTVKPAGSPGYRVVDGAQASLDPLAQRTVMAMRSMSGPLPSGTEFDKYEQVLPGAADRILTMAEKEQGGRLWENKAQIIGKYAITLIAQGASIGLVYRALSQSFELAMHGQEKTAIAISTTTIGSILAAFLAARFINPKPKE